MEKSQKGEFLVTILGVEIEPQLNFDINLSGICQKATGYFYKLNNEFN